jgi:hypothetical protein
MRFSYALLAVALLAACSKPSTTTPPPGDTKIDPGSSCPGGEDLFRTRLWEPLLKTKCIACHNSDGAAQASRFVLARADEENAVARNYATFSTVARLDFNGQPLILLKPHGEFPTGHGGGTLLERGSPESADLELLVKWVRGTQPGCKAPEDTSCTDDAGPRLLRRLSHEEYRNTIHDLLGLSAELVGTLAPDEDVRGFQNDAAALKISPLLAAQYSAIAETLADEAVKTKLNVVVPCFADENAACADQFIRSFGQRAFRRPLTKDEILSYRQIWRDVALETGFLDGIRWTIAAFLQSPNFLYRSELGRKGTDGRFTLTAWEVASELSYLFWQTLPDDALFNAAKDGTLLQPQTLKAQVDRLSKDPRAATTMNRFFDAWLRLDRLSTVPRDMQTFPELTPAIRESMRGEVARYVADQIQNGANLESLFQSKHTFLTKELATYYGIPWQAGEVDADGYRKIDLSGTPYGGLLSLGGVLMTHSLPTSSSPIHRGKLVRERFLCQELPPPPSNLNTSPPPVDPTKSTRERYADHSKKKECAECHNQMDPIGFAFEHFDGAGRWRLKDGTHEIDDSGEIIASRNTNGTFSGVAGLSQKLAASDEVKQCWSEMWTRFGSGVRQSKGLACAVQQKVASGSDLNAIRVALTGMSHFSQRTGDASEGDAVGTEPFEEPGPIEELPPPTGTDRFSLTLVETGRWGTGACFDGTVKNKSEETLDWEVSAELEGVIDNIWNAKSRVDGTKTIFTGESWNKTLEPGATAAFGFCESF